MANDKNPRVQAQPEQVETIFFIAMVRVIELDRVFVVEHGARPVERYAMFFDVGPFLLPIPVEPKLTRI